MPHVRFVDLFSVPADGVTNETRYMPWSGFKGQLMQARSIEDCKDRPDDDENCTLRPEQITHVSFLESEDTSAHAIMVHQLIVTNEEIHEHNVEQHHTEEAEALLWEREHHVVYTLGDFYNATYTSTTSEKTLGIISGAVSVQFCFWTVIGVIGASVWHLV
jgi:hypothetical protein